MKVTLTVPIRHLVSLLFFLGITLNVNAQDTTPLRVFACEPEWQALAEEIGGHRVEVYTATLAQQDPHHVQARPGLISAVRRADMVFCTGGGLEQGWLPVLLSSSANRQVQTAPGLLLATEHVDLLEKHPHAERSDGDIHGDGNPHIHLSPHRLLSVAEVLSYQLTQIDPEHSAHYQSRLEQFRQKWSHKIKEWESALAPLHGKTVITHHRSWSYLLDWAGMSTAAELEPKPGLPPSPGHLQSLVNTATQQPVHAIIYGPADSPKAAQWLAKKTGLCAMQLPYTIGGQAGVTDLFSLFDTTIAQLKQPCGHANGAQAP